jgi:hypothetical protein
MATSSSLGRPIPPPTRIPVKTNSLSQIQSISKTTIATAQAGHLE